MACNKYNRNSNIRLHQLGLEVQAAQSRQSDVEYEATCNIRALALQKLLRRCKCFGSQTYRLEKPGKRLKHRRVIVHHKDHRLVSPANRLRRRTMVGHHGVTRCASAEPPEDQ